MLVKLGIDIMVARLVLDYWKALLILKPVQALVAMGAQGHDRPIRLHHLDRIGRRRHRGHRQCQHQHGNRQRPAKVQETKKSV